MKTDECLPALRALADPTRLKIVELLLGHERNVNELAEEIGTPQYNVSKHLRILREAGVIKSMRAGKETRCIVVPKFQAKIRKGGMAIDLGCCAFRFDDPEKR